MKIGATGKPCGFQAVAVAGVKKLLLSRGLPEPTFECEDNEEYSYCATRFVAAGHEYDLSIQENEISLVRDDKRYGCEMAAGYSSHTDLLNDFLRRLDRLLAGGTWQNPEEKGLLAMLKERMKVLFHG